MERTPIHAHRVITFRSPANSDCPFLQFHRLESALESRVRHLRGHVPLRLDAGLVDLQLPAPLQLVGGHRGGGGDGNGGGDGGVLLLKLLKLLLLLLL